MKFFRILSFVLIFVMTASAAVSCGAPESTTADTTTEAVTTAPPEPEPEPEPIRLRVGSYNIANGKVIGHKMATLAQDIIDLELDIVGLQEVDRLASRSMFIDTAKVLSELTGLEYYYYTKAITIKGDAAKYGQGGEYGTCILSRYPIIESESVMLSSPGVEQRAYGAVQIDIDGVIVNFVNTHLSYEKAEIRQTQFEELASRVEGLERVLVTADFNISSFEDFAPISFLEKACVTHGEPVTFPKRGTTIDNILFSEEFELVERDSLANGHSDHNLLWAELLLSVE